MTISRNISVMAQGASSSGILAGGYGGLGASVSPTTAGNVLFTADGSVWSSTQKIVRGTSVATTSGTSIDFTSIPSWVKRITMMYNGVSTNGTSLIQAQLGTSGGFVTSGYSSNFGFISSTNAAFGATAYTTGLYLCQVVANTDTFSAAVVLNNITGNVWTYSGTGSRAGTGNVGAFFYSAAPQSLSGVLTQVRLTTVNGTDTFDAGSVNILYE
jgi:hypothetical protein